MLNMVIHYGILMEKVPKSVEGQLFMVCQINNRLKQLEQELKVNDRCSDTERKQLMDSLFEHEQVFTLSDEELEETDAGAYPVREAPRRLPCALRKQLEEELDMLSKINCIEAAKSA